MTKRAISLAVVAMMLVAIAIIPASAEEAVVQPRATCTYCGGYATITTTYGSWGDASVDVCEHYSHGYDQIQKRKVAKKYVCSGCTEGDYTSSYYESRRVCHGYDGK